MTIAEYLIKQINNGNLRMDRTSILFGLGETWRFYPNKKYGPGHLVNALTGSVLSVAEISDREIDSSNCDWQLV